MSPSTGSPLCLVACVGGTSTRIAAVDAQGRLLEEQSLPTAVDGPFQEESRASPDREAFILEHWHAFMPWRARFLDGLGRSLAERAAAYRKSGGRIEGIGISAPGAIHPQTGQVLGRSGAPNLPAWGEFNLKEEMEARTGLPVRAVNDAKAMALGALARITPDAVEWVFHAGRRVWEEHRLGREEGGRIRDFIEMDPGTGLGGAYVVNGDLWFGPDPESPDPNVGEIWRLCPDPARPGLRLEDTASGRAAWSRIERRLREEFGPAGDEALREAEGRIQRLLAVAPPALRPAIKVELGRTGAFLAMGMRCLTTRERERLKAPCIQSFMIGGGMVSGASAEAKTVRGLLLEGIRKESGDKDPDFRVLFTLLGGRAGLYGSAVFFRGEKKRTDN